MNVVLHRAPNLLRNVEEVLLEMLVPHTHVDRGGVRGLAECL
jgi:hypothetical protein